MRSFINGLFAYATDSYKLGHADMYPKGTQYVYSNLTPRSNKYATRYGYPENLTWFGGQAAIIKIHDMFQDFFSKTFNEHDFDGLKYFYDLDKLVLRFKRLHELGYLPLKIKTLNEGKKIPMKIPVLTIINTVPEFYWLVNYMETFLSAEIWHTSTTASISSGYKELANKYAQLTCDDNSHVPFQCHDFSMRGHHSLESAAKSGAGHLVNFMGTDTLVSIPWIKKYYSETYENFLSHKHYKLCINDLIGCSVPATEHSVMCSSILTKDTTNLSLAEKDVFEDLIKKYPNGILSIVSDSFDYWNLLTNILPELKEDILNRTGGRPHDSIVIRPDSFKDVVKGICGDPEAQTEYERKGSIEVLWDIFGGEVNKKGYKVLNPKIGLIYGDSITLEKTRLIFEQLKEKGFASSNIVLGIGSFTYAGSTTRDSYGFAVKATKVCVNDKWVSIYKDPKGDSTKKSAKGFLSVHINSDGEYYLLDDVTQEEEKEGLLLDRYIDGRFYNHQTFNDVKHIAKIS